MNASGTWKGLLLIIVVIGYPLAIPVSIGLTISSAQRRWQHARSLRASSAIVHSFVLVSVIVAAGFAWTVSLWMAMLATVIVVNAWAVFDAVVGCGTSPTLRSERCNLVGTRLGLAIWLLSPFITTRAALYAAIGCVVGMAARRITQRFVHDVHLMVPTMSAVVAGFATDAVNGYRLGYIAGIWKAMPLTTMGIAAATALVAMIYAGVAMNDAEHDPASSVRC